jgi:hypothetical protein
VRRAKKCRVDHSAGAVRWPHVHAGGQPGQHRLLGHGPRLSVFDGTNIRFYFGDSWADSAGTSIDVLRGDDTLGIVSGANFLSGDSVDAYIASHPPGPGKLSWQAAAPPVKFQLNAFGRVAMSPLYRGGTSGAFLPSGLGKTPLAAFANRLSGSARGVFAIFHRIRPTECSEGAKPTCSNGFSCDTGLGSYLGFTGENDFPLRARHPESAVAVHGSSGRRHVSGSQQLGLQHDRRRPAAIDRAHA